MKTASTANLGFEDKLWSAANALRGGVPAAEYKNIILGLIFLKYISDAFQERYDELKADDDDIEDKDAYTEVNVFFVPEAARWQTISADAHNESIGQTIDEAMRAIEKENRQLKDTLPKNYAREDLDKRRLGEVVDLFTNIPMVEQGDEKDILGRTYEYCLGKFAQKEGQKGGEFYTPTSIVKTLVAILQPTAGKRIYDPCCGSGGMFIQSAKFIQDHQGNRGDVSIFGQESMSETRRMARMNLAIRGIEADLGPQNADTFTNDLHPTLRADYILANPPFNLRPWNPKGILDSDPRWAYGLPPEGNANFAWLQHMIYHLAPDGKIGMVMANGSLSSNTGSEGDIRRKIVEADLVEGIVALPSNLFYTVTIPACLWIINRHKTEAAAGKTLFVDARNLGHLVDRTHREFDEADDIDKIAQAFRDFETGTLTAEPGFSAATSTEDIAEQDFTLTPGRYVGLAETEDDGEPFDDKMKRLTSELAGLFEQSHKLETEIRKQLGSIGYEV